MKQRYDPCPWKGASCPPNKADNLFMKNLLAGIRKVRQQATEPKPATPGAKGKS